MRKPTLVVGTTFGRLAILSYAGKGFWNCRCSCGNLSKNKANTLKSGHTRSCGCLHRELTGAAHFRHGKSNSRIYASWAAMKGRCDNPTNREFKWYGARGIAYSKSWRSFEAFQRDMGDMPDGYTLERKNVNKGYSKANCCWIPKSDQGRNTRSNRNFTLNGKTQCLAAWARDGGLPYCRVKKRLNSGWSLSQALTPGSYVTVRR